MSVCFVCLFLYSHVYACTRREGGGGGGREAERKVQVPAPGSQWKEREREGKTMWSYLLYMILYKCMFCMSIPVQSRVCMYNVHVHTCTCTACIYMYIHVQPVYTCTCTCNAVVVSHFCCSAPSSAHLSRVSTTSSLMSPTMPSVLVRSLPWLWCSVAH